MTMGMALSRWIAKETEEALREWRNGRKNLVETVRRLYALGYSAEAAWEIVQRT